MKVRLNVRKTRKGDKEYRTYYVTLPREIVESINFSKVEKLELEVRRINDKVAIVLYKP